MTRGLFKTTSAFAIAAAAGLFASSAMAADLGGNCCADLEERVAELEATTARKGNRKVSLTVYGQVNKQLLWHDDKDGYREGKLTVRDNDAGMSRFGFRGEAQIRPDLAAGYVIEIGLGGEDNGLTGDKAFLVRHNYLYLDSQRLGRVSVGQTSQVTDGLYEINLANVQLTPGSMDEHGAVLNDAMTSVFKTPFDGGRKQGVYYRTPSLAGFMLSAGYSHDSQTTLNSALGNADDYWEVALRYAGEFNGVRLAAGVGYRHEKDNTSGFKDDADFVIASGSVMHTPTGLFLSGGYGHGEADLDNAKANGFWVMAGLERNFFGPGATTLYGEYSDVEYKAVDDVLGRLKTGGNYWGLGIVQKVDAAAMDLYLQFRHYKLDDKWYDETDVAIQDDANVVTAGAIIRF